ncbi:MAG: hypothetical protein M3220_10265 [Chloroflexota bacterium]|nr:hypothetical protein [Chloroflexota bacterium]
MNHNSQYQLLKEQALRFHEVCRRFDLYTEPMDEARFLSVIEGFLIRMSRAARPQVTGPRSMGEKLEVATRYLEQFMRPYLPASEASIGQVLERVIREFYQDLVEAQLLSADVVSVEELFEKRLPYLGLTVQAIADGHQSLVTECISLPSYIVRRLDDVVPQVAWDSEWGGEVLLGCVEQFFTRLPFDFAWQYSQDADRVICRVDTHRWAVEKVSYEDYNGVWDDAKVYEETFRQLNHYFARHRLILIDVPTWSQATRWLLVPSEHVKELDKFLGSHDGDFYLMVPHLAVPLDFG